MLNNMKKQLLLILLMCGAIICSAQCGFVVTAPSCDVTKSCGASCQPFIRSSYNVYGYSNEGVNQPFLYRTNDTLVIAESELPYTYRPERVSAAQPNVFETKGYYRVYLRPIIGVDTLVAVYLPWCGYNFVATDIDNNIYHTVLIGNLCWLKENLVTLHYADGSAVPESAVYYANIYPNIAQNLSTYGRLYSWYSVVRVPENDDSAIPDADENGNVQGICPAGWHLPAQSELEQLMAYTSDELKSSETWIDHSDNNYSGFTAVAAGYYNGFRFENLGGTTSFWSSTHTAGATSSPAISLSCGCPETKSQQIADRYKVSVRCVQD